MKEKPRDWTKSHMDFLLYAFFGVLTTLVNLLSFKLFNLILGEDLYLISNIIAWFLSVIFAYITNKLWVFQVRSFEWKVLRRELFSFFAARLFSLFIEEGGLFLFVDCLNFDRFRLSLFGLGIGGKMIAKLCLAVIVVILNYFFSKAVIFRKKHSSQ